MCQNDQVSPYPVVACAADFQTNLDARGTQLVESLIDAQLARGGIVVAAAHQRLLASDARAATLELG